MRRMKDRAAAALVLAGLVVIGLLIFLFRLVADGENWAGYSANRHAYQDGVLKSGEITDRNGEMLLSMQDGKYIYNDDYALRTSTLHAVGDWRGYISGAMHTYAGKLSGYSFINGTPDGGAQIRLALDANLQTAAWDALKGRNGAVIVLNYRTGEVLCMVSSPSYDPNGSPDTSVDGLFLNRAIGAAFTPGSVFKLVTLIAAKEEMPDLSDRLFTCKKTLEVGGDVVTCGKSHGAQTIEEALQNSCNCVFGELALELGGETLAKYADKLGVTQYLQLDGLTTAAGNFSVAEPGTSYEAWSGIGQYEDLVTPLAMARLCAAVANGGVAKEPTLLLNGKSKSARLMSGETADFVRMCMLLDVEDGYGSDRFPGLLVGGKTGTAEVGDGTTHAWFTGFSDDGLPLAFAVVLERGGGGSKQAIPLANKVLQKAAEIYRQ